VAVADFDAVVSGDIYVLAPKQDRLLPELLPFLCLSERFFQHAVGTSAGSLSPRTNWSSLANFEFDLPPLDQQRRIADMLWAIDSYVEGALNLSDSLHALIGPSLMKLLTSGLRDGVQKESEIGLLPSTWQLGHIRDLVQPIEHALLAGPFGTIFKTRDFREQGIRIIQLRHVTEQGFVWGENETYMDQAVYDRLHTPYTVRPGDLLITKMGEPPGIACIYPKGEPLAMVTPDVIKATIYESRADTRFLRHLYNSPIVRRQVLKLIKGATRPRVSLNEFFRLKLPIPPLAEQKEIASIADSLESDVTAAQRSSRAASRLQIELTQAILAI
jgi:type I restriction enzyme S subunit